MRRRLVAILFVLGVVLGVMPSPAEAVPSPYKRGDRLDATLDTSDIRHLVVIYNQNDVIVTFKTEDPLNLETSSGWKRAGSKSRIFILIDTTGSDAAEFRVIIRPNAGVGASAVLQQMPSATDRCFPFLTQPTSREYIRVRFEHECIDSPAHLRLYGRYKFDQGGDGTANSDDRVPNFDRTPFIDPPG